MFKVIVDQNLVSKLAKEEISRIIGESGSGTWWDLKRLEAETCRKRDWLIENILLNPIFKLEMNDISNKCESGRWMFKGEAMRNFLNIHFHELNKSSVKGVRT